jgi:putative transcriptional regulator
MVQVLRNKNLATRFQILVEIAANQPHIPQKDIAKRIGLTSQAVSDYVSKLEKDGWISTDGRSNYRVTKEGVGWLLKALREMQDYTASAERILTGIATWAAIAARDVRKGDTVGLAMIDGLLHAVEFTGKGARGTASNSAAAGEDVGVTSIEGIITLEPGQVTIMEVPDIQRGGSRHIDLNKLTRQLVQPGPTAALGIEAVVALWRVGHEPDYLYGVTQAAIEAARSGLSFTVVCASGESPALQQRLSEEGVRFEVIDLKSARSRTRKA